MSIIANDKFKPLYSFWNCCKCQNEKLCSKLKKINVVTKDIFTDYRKNIMEEENELKQAIYYFVINRCSFSGSTLSGGFSQESSEKRFTKSSIERINKLELKNFTILNEDFVDFFDTLEQHDDQILFLDPPYFLGEKSKLYGNNGDHVKKMYADCIILNASWKYGMNQSK